MRRGLPGLSIHPLPRLKLLCQRFKLLFMDCLRRRVLLPMSEPLRRSGLNTHSLPRPRWLDQQFKRVFLNGLGSPPLNTTLK